MNKNVAIAKKKIVARFIIENVLSKSQPFFRMKKTSRSSFGAVPFVTLIGEFELVGQLSKMSIVRLGQGTQEVFVHIALPMFRGLAIPSFPSLGE
jgi:hypothetical protein